MHATIRRHLVVFLLTGLIAGCGTKVPTDPSSTGSGNDTPRLDSIQPTPLVQSDLDQTISVAGNGFVTGLTLTVADPSGVTDVVSGGRISRVTSVSFDASIRVPATGSYSMFVTTPAGLRSTTVQVNVLPRNNAGPVVASASPNPVVVSSVAVLVTISGQNFDATDVVHVVDPSSVATDLSSTQVQISSPTLLQFFAVFNQRGTYQVSVTDGQGRTSSPVLIVAN